MAVKFGKKYGENAAKNAVTRLDVAAHFQSYYSCYACSIDAFSPSPLAPMTASCYRIFSKNTVVLGEKFVFELNSINAFNANLKALHHIQITYPRYHAHRTSFKESTKSLLLRNEEHHELYIWQNVTKFGRYVRKMLDVRFPKKEKRSQKSLILNPTTRAGHSTLIVVG